MTLTHAREDLHQALEILEHIASHDTKAVGDKIRHALHDLEPERLLTTSEAAELLGVKSVNTVKLWCRNGLIRGMSLGARTMIPLSEVERIRNSAPVRAIRASDRLHAATADLGTTEGLDDEQLSSLAASRPGRLPWQT